MRAQPSLPRFSGDLLSASEQEIYNFFKSVLVSTYIKKYPGPNVQEEIYSLVRWQQDSIYDMAASIADASEEKQTLFKQNLQSLIEFVSDERTMKCYLIMSLGHDDHELFSEYLKIIGDCDSFIPKDLMPNYDKLVLHRVLLKNVSENFYKVLQDHGVKNFAPRIPQDGNTPILWATANAHNLSVINFLKFCHANGLDAGINLQDFYPELGNTVLHLAVAKDYLDKDSSDNPTDASNLELVKTLIACGADPNIKNAYHAYTALDIAVFKGSKEMVEEICNSSKLTAETIERSMQWLRAIKPKDLADVDFKPSVSAIIADENKDILIDEILRNTCGGKFFRAPDVEGYSKENIEALAAILERAAQKVIPSDMPEPLSAAAAAIDQQSVISGPTT
jgi:ankyrin repeat protein